ncbi:hypothetical protein V499_08664 [Pseudogymnoascus sp. VKM F-103]|nr:hypothetical protein V499_08664 [Pseudogymnoascus sp. VKM F-103]
MPILTPVPTAQPIQRNSESGAKTPSFAQPIRRSQAPPPLSPETFLIPHKGQGRSHLAHGRAKEPRKPMTPRQIPAYPRQFRHLAFLVTVVPHSVPSFQPVPRLFIPRAHFCARFVRQNVRELAHLPVRPCPATVQPSPAVAPRPSNRLWNHAQPSLVGIPLSRPGWAKGRSLLSLCARQVLAVSPRPRSDASVVPHVSAPWGQAVSKSTESS